ncbi:Creatinine amidohydrolase [Shimia thalassica]|uniref:Creatinine amidohydrolase n=1 Tax=Shimia thalassica TaxID=1715693 RepID=A0A0N7MA50_9RHOB|nr:creatininase family protein [Shimia thalassica]CUK07471.1 Creatinine amidohydrolase [Shimia thalassica]
MRQTSKWQGYWADLSTDDFANLPEDTIAILPLGATEQHGPHLPLSVDTTLTNAVLAQSRSHWSEDTHALILPTLTVTKSNEHMAHAGTLSLSVRTLLAMLDDIGASVARAGVKRLIMLNGHGGNTALLEIAVREMRVAHGLITAHASWFGFSETEGLVDPADAAHDLHGGDIETSAMLAVRPDHVDMSKAPNSQPKSRLWQENLRWTGLNGQAARPGWVIADLQGSGVCGNASAATRDKGEAMLSSAARNFAAFLAEFSTFEPTA